MNTLELIIEHLQETLPPEYYITTNYNNLTISTISKTNSFRLYLIVNSTIITIWSHKDHPDFIDLNHPNSFNELTTLIINHCVTT